MFACCQAQVNITTNLSSPLEAFCASSTGRKRIATFEISHLCIRSAWPVPGNLSAMLWSGNGFSVDRFHIPECLLHTSMPSQSENWLKDAFHCIHIATQIKACTSSHFSWQI